VRNIVEEKRLIPLKFDLMFKKVFGDKENTKPLKTLLKCILDIEAKEITILNPEILGSSYYDKRTIVDLIVELEDGTKIGIEMNTNVNSYLVDRNIFYMFKIMSGNMRKGSLYNELKKHIQINIDCEGKHIKPIETYKIIEEEKHKVLTNKIEIIRVDLPYFVEKCYNLDAKELDYKDKFIGLIGIEDRDVAKNITEGEKDMEEILDKVEDFSDDDEILGAYDAEWHKIETERVVRLANMEDSLKNKEEAERNKEEAEKNKEEAERNKEEAERNKEEAERNKEEAERNKEEAMKIQNQREEIEMQGILKTARNMLKENIDIQIISKVTGLNTKQIEEL